MISPHRFSSAAILVFGLAACADSNGPGSGPTVSLSFASRLPAGAAAPSRAAGLQSAVTGADTLTDGTNTLIITKAELVLREIELKRQEVANCDVQPKPQGCKDFEVGPLLIDLPLGAGTAQQVTVDIPPGTYTEVEFEIHKVSKDDPQDSTFRRLHPDFLDRSIRVQGTFNGTAFTYVSDLNVEQELEFAKPLVITDTTTATNLTIRVVLADWFRSASGGLLDPASANRGQPNESLVKENIKRSMKAFEDRDRDGDDRDER
jgi:hypothetical protein